jgi:hypothetical protein
MPSASVPASLNDIALAIAADATRLPAARTHRRCPCCDGRGSVVVGYDDCDDVERCLVCRETGRVRTDAVVFRSVGHRTWSLIAGDRLCIELIEELVHEGVEWADADSLFRVLDFCTPVAPAVQVAA